MTNRDTKQNKSSKNAPSASQNKKQGDRQVSDKMSVDSQSEFAVADKLRDKANQVNKKS